MPEKYRTEAYCYDDARLVPIVKVRASTRLISTGVEAHQALVGLACGHQSTIVTTARNLREMEVASGH